MNILRENVTDNLNFLSTMVFLFFFGNSFFFLFSFSSSSSTVTESILTIRNYMHDMYPILYILEAILITLATTIDRKPVVKVHVNRHIHTENRKKTPG